MPMAIDMKENGLMTRNQVKQLQLTQVYNYNYKVLGNLLIVEVMKIMKAVD